MKSPVSFRADQVSIVPLGDQALLVRFGAELDDRANRRAVAFAQGLQHDLPGGVVEVVPSLVSVLVRYDPLTADPVRLAGELSLRLSVKSVEKPRKTHVVSVQFGGEAGPDLVSVADELGLDVASFIKSHNREPLRVLTTGFAPGFVYCGFHGEDMVLPRRAAVRAVVPAGSVLFAAGQTAIAATDIPTGWHVIGRTELRNFDAGRQPTTLLAAGDLVRFEAVA